MMRFEQRDSFTFVNEGMKLFGVIHRPLNITTPPVVLICHGFAGTKTGRRRHYVRLAQSLAKAGIATLRFDFRGNGDSEGEMSELTLEGEVSDALAALKVIEMDKNLDSERIGILGRSLGGAVSVLTAQRYEAIKSMVLWAPLFSSEKWKNTWNENKDSPEKLKQFKEIQYFHGGMPSKDFLNQFFNLNIADAILSLSEIPLLHIHGESDEIIPALYQKDFERIRSSSLAPSNFILIENGDHDFTDPEVQAKAISTTTEWFKETL
ncbi:MAG: alpha/beta fold hydrolase [Chlamydiales bacterium]